MIYGIIYKITDLENGKCYIGQTIDYTRRKRDYKYSRNAIESYGYDNCNNITKAFFDKGYDNFEFSVIDAGDSPEELCELENYWIDYYDSINPEKGYNETYAVIRRPISEKTKKKMSRIKGEFKHSAKTKLKKSIPIIAYKDGNFTRYVSSKEFARIHNTERTYVSRAAKHGKTVLGYNIFYAEKIRREEIYNKLKNNLKYRLLYESIEEDLETIESKLWIDIIY